MASEFGPLEDLADAVLLGNPVDWASAESSAGAGNREAVRQLSFRCPVLLASDLRKKAAFNQLEQQQIIVEGIKRVLAELPDPPEGWQG